MLLASVVIKAVCAVAGLLALICAGAAIYLIGNGDQLPDQKGKQQDAGE